MAGAAQADGWDGERERMERLTAALPTKAAKIRALDDAGYRRSEIAAFLGVRYQHVRNVLIDRAAKASRAIPAPREEATTLRYGRTSFDAAGMVALPQSALDELGVRPGDVVPWRIENGEVTLMGPAAAIRRAQEIVARSWKSDKSATELLYEERERELALERRQVADRDDD